MENVWVLAALWVGLALLATLLAIWFEISTALTGIVVGTVAQLIMGPVSERVLRYALESFSGLLHAWGADASTDLEHRFDSFANRYRAQLERLLSDRTPSSPNSTQAGSDLAALARMVYADSSTKGEAIAS